ncbi:MAG TPA: hypothetical protein VF522_22135 [Ramlibacter sp.]|uniref:hypothetical protein n=1 Tax=Ramlibacter sp. TaxID=1917967 RepID=UPI002ED15186
MKVRAALGRLRPHSLFLLYAFSLLWLLAACVYFADSSATELDFVRPLLVFGSVFVTGYLLLTRVLGRRIEELPASPLPQEHVRLLLVLLFGVFTAVAIMHLATLGHLPMVEARRSTNDYEIARIRQEGYYNLAVWQRYASDYAIKGVGPILLVLAAHTRSRLLWPAIVVGLFYTVSLFVKANPVYLLLPLVLYYAFTRQARRALLMALLMVGAVGVNWTSSSPDVRNDFGRMVDFATGKPVRQVSGARSMNMDYPGARVVASVRERLVIVPAQVTAQWYFNYEDPARREAGCGYRLLARAIGCEYQHIPTKLYAMYYPELVKERGLTGSLNSGSYIHDFANFGYAGVAVGALAFALLFSLLRFACSNSAPLLCLSLMPVLSLSEMPISTVLNSGGWLLILFVSVLLQQGGRLLQRRRPASA